MIRFLLAAGAFALAIPAACPAFAQPAAPAGTAAEARMAHISVVSMGTGEPVILIPGMASPRAVWDGIAPELARTHRVLLVQVNGFAGDDVGDNGKPGIMDGVVADIAALIEREGLGRPAVIGHSMGGTIGMMLASRHPERVGRLIVVDALPFFGALFGPDATVASIAGQAARIRDTAIASAGAARQGPVTADPGGIWSNHAAGRIAVQNWSVAADPRVVGHAMYDMLQTDLRGELARITARPFRVLVATGSGPQAMALFARGYAGSPAELVPVADSWHFIQLDQPAAFAAQVAAFLAQ